MSSNRRITLLRPSQIFDSFMDEFFNAPDWKSSNIGDMQINMHEDDNNLFVEVKAPGFKKEEVNIELENDLLTIHAKKSTENEEQDKKKKYYMQEFSSEEVRRVMTLPVRVDSEKISAKAEDGLIKISMPKLAESKAKKIAITAQ